MPLFESIKVNGSSDHFLLEAGIVNQITLKVTDNNLSQVKLTLERQGDFANHEHMANTNFFGLKIPNHGSFAYQEVRNVAESNMDISFMVDIPFETFGLWNLKIQALDQEGNLNSKDIDVSINSMAYPFVSISSMNPGFAFGDGNITADSGSPWQWEGEIFDLDSLDYVRITIQQNGDTISSFIAEDPQTWTMDLTDIPMSMPSTIGQYQWRLEMADHLGRQTWRTSTLIIH
jgi:hypothetical protein